MIRIALTALLFGLPTTSFASHEWEDRDLTNGQALYAENCASCHGENLEGQPNWRTPGEDGVMPAPPHDETGHTWHHDGTLLFNYTKFGGEEALKTRGITGFKSGMPAVDEALSDNDIWDILSYIRSTWSDEIKTIQSQRTPPH